jgi:hypothetical protein
VFASTTAAGAAPAVNDPAGPPAIETVAEAEASSVVTEPPEAQPEREPEPQIASPREARLPTDAERPPKRRIGAWAIAAVVVLALAGAGVAYALASGGSGDATSPTTSPSAPASASPATANLSTADLQGRWDVELTMQQLDNWDAANTDSPIWTFADPPAVGDTATDTWALGPCRGADPCVMTFTSHDRPGRFENGFQRHGVRFGASEHADSPCGQDMVTGLRSFDLRVAEADGASASAFDGTFAVSWTCPRGKVSSTMTVHGTRIG